MGGGGMRQLVGQVGGGQSLTHTWPQRLTGGSRSVGLKPGAHHTYCTSPSHRAGPRTCARQDDARSLQTGRPSGVHPARKFFCLSEDPPQQEDPTFGNACRHVSVWALALSEDRVSVPPTCLLWGRPARPPPPRRRPSAIAASRVVAALAEATPPSRGPRAYHLYTPPKLRLDR